MLHRHEVTPLEDGHNRSSVVRKCRTTREQQATRGIILRIVRTSQLMLWEGLHEEPKNYKSATRILRSYGGASQSTLQEQVWEYCRARRDVMIFEQKLRLVLPYAAAEVHTSQLTLRHWLYGELVY